MWQFKFYLVVEMHAEKYMIIRGESVRSIECW